MLDSEVAEGVEADDAEVLVEVIKRIRKQAEGSRANVAQALQDEIETLRALRELTVEVWGRGR